MKTIGIIGGLGPETSSKFYLELIYQAFKVNKVSRPPILMWSVPIDYQVESDFIEGKDRSGKYIELLTDAAKRLESGGANFIVIPCNSVHIFIEEVRKAVSIPVLSIVEETSAFLTKRHISSVGVLATTASLKARLYQNELGKHAISMIEPSSEDQKMMGVLINKLVRDEYSDYQKTELLEIVSHLKDRGTHTILLACTDLQLLAPKYDEIEIFDTMEILVQSTVKQTLS